MENFENVNNILDMEISEEVAAQLSEALVAWKEEYASSLEERNSAVLEEKIQELEELNEVWREEMAEEYSDRLISALSEMKDEVKANVLAEYVDTDPTHRVMEEIKRLVAPTINEEYTKNVYLEELLSLRDQVNGYEKEKELKEGANTLEELIENYDDKVKPLLREMLGKGTSEEIEEKFYRLVSVLNEDDDEDDFDEDEEDDDFDFDFDDLDDDFDFDDDEEDFEEDFDWDDEDEFSSIFEEFEEEGDASGVGPGRRAMLNLIK